MKIELDAVLQRYDKQISALTRQTIFAEATAERLETELSTAKERIAELEQKLADSQSEG